MDRTLTPDCGVYRTFDSAGNEVFTCRCIVCSRCKEHTGNTNQGHYWAWCMVLKHDAGSFHFCCPGDCELH